MYGYQPISPDEEEKLIKKVGDLLHKKGLSTTAVLFLQSSKPLIFIGGELGRFFVTPFLSLFQENLDIKSEKFLRTLDRRENVEKLILYLEKLEKNLENEKKEKNQKKSYIEKIRSFFKRARIFKVFEVYLMVWIKFPSILTKITKEKEIFCEASNVEEIINKLINKYGSSFQKQLYDDKDEWIRYWQIFINGKNIRLLKYHDTELKEDDIMIFLPVIQGG
jgi:molybdopterin converting factor small subunit